MSRLAINRRWGGFCLIAALAVSPLASLAATVTTTWVATATKALPLRSSVATTAVPNGKEMHVLISLKLQNVDQLKQFLKNQQTAGSPQYGVSLTPAEFAAQYSPSQQQAQSVVDYLGSAGFKNIKVEPNRVVISATGTAAIAQKAFNTKLAQFQFNGKTVFAPVTDVMVPDSIGANVLSILGLQNVATKTPTTKSRKAADEIRRGAVTHTDAGTPALVDAYTSEQTEMLYDAGTTPTGAGTTIAISTAGDDLTQVVTDLRIAETTNGRPQVPVSVVQVAPLPSPQDTSGDGEWDLDSQTSTGIAGNVKGVIFYNATDLGDSLLMAYNQFVTDDVAKAGNMSYGGCEILDAVLGGTAADDQAFMQADAQGQSWFASAGDAGAACGLLVNIVTPDFGLPANVEYPAASPYVVAVGGTTLLADSNFNYVAETSWDAGGGGVSYVDAAPSWQSGIVPTAGLPRAGRGVPDVAMVAGGPDVGTPVGYFGFGGADIISNGADSSAIGTSWSSPLSVGVWARLQSAHCNAFGFAAPIFYALDTAGGLLSTAAGFRDTLIGTNGQYVATLGWDYTTGFGSFDISAINAALPAPAPGCTTVVAAPTASLSTLRSVGPAPFAVHFFGARSSDPAGLAITNYAIDFGDGSFASQSTPEFPLHTYANPGTYTATLTVTNSGGGVSKPSTLSVTSFGTPQACSVPGQVLLTSPSGVADATEGIDLGRGADDLLSTSVSEPFDQAGKLILTTKVATLSSVPPGFRWVTYFDVAGRTEPNTEYYYVAMVSADGAKPVFNYGTHSYLPGPEPLSVFKVLGTLDASSNYTADGTITLVLDKAALQLNTGDALTNIYSSVRTSTPDTASVPGGAGLTQDSAGTAVPYRLVGNDTCGPSVAPIANLTATRVAGKALKYVLDGSASTEPDANDFVAYFRFNPGDGSPFIWQSISELQHVYSTPGTYKAFLTVANTHGQESAPKGLVIKVK